MPLTKTKLLLLNVNRSGWHSGNMIYDMEAVKRACDTKFYGPGWDGYKYTDLKEIIKQLYGDDKPDIIYSYFTPNERVRDVYQQKYKIPNDLMNFPKNLDKIDAIKIFALSDFWSRNPNQYAKDLKDSTFKYCFACFAPPYSNPKNFYSFFNTEIQKDIKFMGYPRCVDKECFRDYGLEKKYDVVTLGAMWGFYPLRCHIHNTLSKTYKSLGIKYHNYPHCGTDFTHTDFVREKYAMAINESKILASCGGRYHVAYNKIFESMGCGTVYVGEKPWGEEELHMKDGDNYIAVTDSNFEKKIVDYLKNPDELAKIAKNGQETFLKHHHIDARANDFVNLIKDLN